MRLVDADELKKESYTITELNGDVHKVVCESAIDNAPTVEIPRFELLEDGTLVIHTNHTNLVKIKKKNLRNMKDRVER